MIDDFLIRTLIAGVGIAFICGVMGCFVVWRRMAYFGDSLAHSALLGIAIGLATGLSTSLSIFIISMVFALLLLWLQHRGVLAMDTLLGILAHGALSSGMVLMSLQGIPIDLHRFLFGDILTVNNTDLMLIGAGVVIVLGLLARFWAALILMTVSQDLAKAEGVRVLALQMLFLVLMTVTVAVSVRMVGVLLITSMLIIPAATARQAARTPAIMAAVAVVIGMIGVGLGTGLSMAADTPTGPSIVASLAAIFAVTQLVMRALPRQY